MNARCRRAFLLLLALTPGLPRSAAAVPHWEGDNLTGNNPPAQNAALPDGLKNAIVRVRTFFGDNLQGSMTDVLASGCVLTVKRDTPTSETGRICVLTSDHNLSVPAGKKFNFWQVGFGNGQFDGEIPGNLRGFVNNKLKTKSGLQISMTAKNGKRPDIGILGILVEDWSLIPGTLEPPPVDAQAATPTPVVAGYGDAGTVETGDRRYSPVSEYGTLRAGTNQVDQVVDHTNGAKTRANVTGEYKALEGSMQFHPDAPAAPTAADAHILNKDSGGPTLQKVDDKWRLIGVHSESENDAQNRIPEGKKMWDVRAAQYSEFIKESCKAVEEMPNEEKKKPGKEKPGHGGQKPVSYDGGLEQLSLTLSPIDDTGYPGDPILSADAIWPVIHLLGATPTGDFVFNSDSSASLVIAYGPSIYLRARVPLLIYETGTRRLVGLLRNVRLAGASPSQPFYDPTLVAPDSPWIASLREGLDPASSGYLGGEGLWVELSTSQDLASLSSGFNATASTSGHVLFYADGPLTVPAASPLGIALLSAGLASLAGLRFAARRRRQDAPAPTSTGRPIRR